jgi:molybdopterin-guanine dinucleotide biosynthesis protein B
MTPVVTFIGPSGTGKTQLIVKLIQLFRDKGYRIGAIKHTHHNAEEIEQDRPGKDSHCLREAGAKPVLIVGLDHLAGIDEDPTELRLERLVERYYTDCDLVLAEGFSDSLSPKVVVRRSGVAEKPAVRKAREQGEVIALVSNSSTYEADHIRCFSVGEPQKLADFLQERFLS